MENGNDAVAVATRENEAVAVVTAARDWLPWRREAPRSDALLGFPH